MIAIERKEDCCGCSACMSICPAGAIGMYPDDMGFPYPKADASKCVDCGLCEKVCAFRDDYDRSMNLDGPEFYAFRHKDEKEIDASRSGAAFTALSDRILERGGVVYGAAFTGHFRVAHERAVSKEERDRFKGSKYVQSDMGDIFRQVKKDLSDGRVVLFSGTPCQTSGLRSYIGAKSASGLYLADIVCHGVPAPYLWRDYIGYIEKKHGSKIVSADFRDKKATGWSGHAESFILENGKKIVRDTYTFLFYKHIMFRPSCGTCRFANTERPSDITLADFWGWEKSVPLFNVDDRGCSLLIVNTEKGRMLLSSVRKDAEMVPVRKEDAMQPNLQHPSGLSPESGAFCAMFVRNGFAAVSDRYGNTGWRYRWRMAKYDVKCTLRRILKNFAG